MRICSLEGMRTLFIAVALSFAQHALAIEPPLRPNVVVLLADDLGWGDVGWHDGEIKTPNLDKLAMSGARLEQFYVQPVCSPTRAALMTGRYPMRHGLQVGVVRPWAQYGLPLDERTLPQALKEAGYTTAICGKWHLGHFRAEYLPTKRGFDRQYGHYNGALDYFTHIRDGGFDWHRDDKVCRDEGYTTHLVAREAVRIVEEVGGTKPFFLYVPFNAVHAPHQAPPSYSEPYANMKGERRIYAGMVAAMDEAVGQIVAAIDKQGLRERTLFIFSSDNGGPQPGVITSNGKLRAGKATLYEGGVRVAACASWKGQIPTGSSVNQPLHVVDWYPTLLNLAGASLSQTNPLDGKDAWATISAGKPSPHDEILLNTTQATGAIRVGNFKLIVQGGVFEGDEAIVPGMPDSPKTAKKKSRGRVKGEPIELFDLENDPYEKTNLATKLPDKVKQLQARLAHYASQAIPPKVRPKPANFQSPRIWGEFAE